MILTYNAKLNIFDSGKTLENVVGSDFKKGGRGRFFYGTSVLSFITLLLCLESQIPNKNPSLRSNDYQPL